ncbi:GH92 family glycosyl hydrolase [Sunxiuqinia sp. A32]|uniref:GH92 family glycosyl hydrolase n=1 Tax=Sunxiuqinia sp. A32 TaxID=3461496 RepID=UPI00404675A9
MKFKNLFFAIVAILGLNIQCQTPVSEKTPVDYVNPYIGTINPKTRGLTPVIKVPGGSVGLFPSFNPEVQDSYLSDKLFGFPTDFANIMINTGEVKIGAKENASTFDHDLETATPYYYQVLLEDPNINTEYTLTDHTLLFRFTLPENTTSNLLLNLRGNAAVEIKDNNTLEGTASYRRRNRSTYPSNDVTYYFTAKLNKPLAASGSWKNESISSGAKSVSGERAGMYISYATKEREVLEVQIGISTKSQDEAQSFLKEEVGSKSFDQVKDQAKELWNDELGLIKIKGGTEKQRTVFYSSLYRTRSTYMGNVWDTYRCAYPLQGIIHPEDNVKAIQDFVSAYEETGWLPSSGAMIGHHSTAVIADSYLKGLRGFDVERAYEGLKKNHLEATMIPWKDAGYVTELEQCYFDNGFFPALTVRKDAKEDGAVKVMTDRELYQKAYVKMPYQITWLPEVGVDEWVKEVDPWHRRQSVSVTLEHCYDDWCLAQFAKALGKDDDYQLFMKRAHNYQNLFNKEAGFMWPKTADGEWVKPFDPKLSGGFAGEGYFAEGNSWTYTWHVQHDVQGLINLMGGRDQFVDKLNALFIEGRSYDKLAFLGQMPDMTGLVGQFCMGNEPSFHIPYLYNYAGQPWMTQNKVRMLMDLWFDATPFGLCGDEDGGSMTSWYAFSAMGFYPQCPGQPVYDIGSPVFEETTINVGGGKTFVVEAKNVSAQNKYIQSATLNGKALDKVWFSHSDIINGGKLILEMGNRPNKEWGSSPNAAAPSMSSSLGS